MSNLYRVLCCDKIRLLFYSGKRFAANIHTASALCNEKGSIIKENEQVTRKPKIEVPPEFSKSASYPSRMKLYEQRMEEDGPQFSNKLVYLARFAVFGMVLFMIYANFFSDYNLEIEENLGNQLPGYREYMKKNYPQYEERLNKLREKQALKPHE